MVDASDSALELMQGGEMSIIHIHISVQSRFFLSNRTSDDVRKPEYRDYMNIEYPSIKLWI